VPVQFRFKAKALPDEKEQGKEKQLVKEDGLKKIAYVCVYACACH
jgi:hypothetical protein